MIWDSASAKAQLRSSIQRLGQLQAKKDADAAITRRDIATLLQQGNVALARSKAQKLIQEDSLADLLEVLEQQVGTLLDRFSELEQKSPPSPALLEATSSIIFAAPRTEVRDLAIISDMISNRLGPGVIHSARDNKGNTVSPGVLRATSRPSPSAAHLDAYLERIARSYGISWAPGPQRQDLINPLSEILDPGSASLVDIARLRNLCARGIPDEPGWLRPRIWKLFMNILPVDKAVWEREITKQRESYYDLVRRLLSPFTELPAPTQPFSGPDERLLEVYKHLSRIPADLFNQLDSEPEELDTCPLHQAANEEIRIPFANCLDSRLRHICQLSGGDRNGSGISPTPEIRLEVDPDATPAISLTEPNAHLNDNNAPTTLLSSKSVTLGSASQRHASALLRLLYIHASINPGNLSPYVPSLLVPLYTALLQDIEPESMAHVEADSFWLFEAFVGEFAELEDEEGSDAWMKRLGEKLGQKDPEFLEQLNDLGLHPQLPHYSRRWLASILTHTLPLPAIYPIWDVMLSQPGRERGNHPRLDSLIEICTAILISAKPLIFKQQKAIGLWDGDPLNPTAQPGEGFLEALSILQSYPINLLGGVDTILQLTLDFKNRSPHSTDGGGKNDQLGFGARIKVTMWKGFTNQVGSPERSDDEESSSESEEEEEGIDDGNDTETPGKDPSPNSLTSRIANTVWRGITNQSSMEAPPSPVLVPSPEASRPTTPSTPFKEQPPSPGSELPKENSQSAPAGLWTYTEKLRDSDTMATLAKLSSNWRAKAMLSSWGRPKEPDSAPPILPQETRSAVTSPVQKTLDPDFRRSSLPVYDRGSPSYTPPPRPAFFRNPRDSFIPPEAVAPPLSPVEMSQEDDPSQGEKSSGGLLEKTRNLQSSLLSLARTSSPMPPPSTTPKAAPRPLMLSSSTLITSENSGRSRVTPPSNIANREDWADVMKLRKSQLHRDSMSSVSSLSPSDAFHRKPEYDSDASTSRVVPLNRRVISPMAPVSKSHRSRPPSTASTASSEQATPSTPTKGDPTEHQDTVNVASPRDEEVTTNGQADAPIVEGHASLTRKSYRRKPQPALALSGDTSDSSIGDTNSRAARLRNKRYPPRLSNLHIENPAQEEDTKRTGSSNLAVPWPSEDQDIAVTPKATTFDTNALPQSPLRSPKTREERSRKSSNNSRHRKLSNSNRESVVRRSRSDSAAEDGDDEGYDDLLSAYESEESSLLT